MNLLQHSLEESLAKIPHMFLAKLISNKLQEQKIKVPNSLPAKIAEHILSGNTGPFRSGRSSEDRSVTISIDDEETAKLASDISNFLQTGLPELLPYLARRLAKDILKELQSRWSEDHTLQIGESTGFRERLEGRWGGALNGLRMLLTIARDWGREAHNRRILRKAKNKIQKEILLRLHVRACQVTDEIICLLENGFADGAMARWRTLHELAVVAAVISQHGENIAERYMAHQAIESKRAMNKYVSSSALLGFKPISPREVNKIEKAYRAAIAKYGRGFDADFGWATHHLKVNRVTFADLEVEAGRADMRSYYQMGNDNVHAGVKSLFVRLGLLDDYQELLAGRSNVGLTEPGQNAAHTLTQLSVLVCLSDATFDNIVIAEMMRQLRDQIPKAFYRAERELRRDDKKFKTLKPKRRSSRKSRTDTANPKG